MLLHTESQTEGNEDGELELELAELELGMLNEEVEIPSSGVDSLPHTVNEDTHEASSVEDVVDVFKHMSLEPEQA